jgi:glutamate dehydrogenase
MLLKAQKGNAEIIEKVAVLVRKKAPKGIVARAETFIRQYYSQVDPEDLAERNISDLCGAALAHLDFMREFQTGAPKLRVYNPQTQTTDGSPRIRLSRSSMTTCRSWWTR